MITPEKITDRVYLVGGPGMTDSRDCCIYLVDGSSKYALIDAGLGDSAQQLVENIKELGLNPGLVKYVIATHGHIDHAGGLKFFQDAGAKIACHRDELEAITGGWPELTAAWIYKVNYCPVQVDMVLTGGQESIRVGDTEIHCLLTPGHTQGSISPYLDTGTERVLFGQDIHGPFDSSWGSNMEDWHTSMQSLLELNADILCEGHFGIYRPSGEVKRYIKEYVKRYS